MFNVLLDYVILVFTLQWTKKIKKKKEKAIKVVGSWNTVIHYSAIFMLNWLLHFQVYFLIHVRVLI